MSCIFLTMSNLDHRNRGERRKLLFRHLYSPAGVSVARIGGAAIVALAIVCGLAHRDVHSPASGLVVAMLFYNVAVAGVLAFAGFGHDLHGILLSPAVAFHFVMAAWCAVRLLRHGFFPAKAAALRRTRSVQPLLRCPKENKAMIKSNYLATAVLALPLTFGGLASAQTPARKPNIVMIMADDVGIRNISQRRRQMKVRY